MSSFRMVPLMDRGWSWVVMVSSFVNNLALFGMLKCGGIVYLAFMEELNMSRSQAVLVPNLMFSLSCLLGPVSMSLSSRYSQKIVVFCGGLMAGGGLALAAAFHYSYTMLIIFYGIISGFGIGLILLPNLTIVHEYFLKHRSLAVGFSMVGASVGSFAVPPLMETVLEKYSLQSALLFLSAVLLHVCPAALLFRPRPKQKNDKETGLNLKVNDEEKSFSLVEEAESMIVRYKGVRNKSHRLSNFLKFIDLDLSIFKEKNFYLMTYSLVIFGIVWAPFITFLPEYANKETIDNVEPRMAAYIVSAMSSGDLICRFFFGWLLDRGWVQRKRAFVFFMGVSGCLLLGYTASHSYLSVMVLSVFFGVFIAGVIILHSVLMNDFMGPKRFPAAFGISSTVNGVTMMCSVAILAYIREVTGSSKTCFLVMGFCFLSAVLLWILDEIITRLKAK